MRPALAPVAALVAALILALPAFGQDAVRLVPPGDAMQESRHSVGVAGFTTEIRLRNAATDPATGQRLLVPSGQFLRQGDGKAEPATWDHLPAAPAPWRLAPGAEARLRLSGTLPQAGTYETWIDIAAPPGGDPASEQRIRVVVTRTAGTLPAEFIAAPQPAAGDLGLVPSLFWVFGARPPAAEVVLGLRNSTTGPVEFTAPVVLSYARQEGERTTAVAAARPPQLDSAACRSPLPAGTSCAVTLRLDPDAWAGRYLVEIGAGGPGGGWSQRSQTVDLRASALLAFLLIAAGVAIGALVNAWRATGRQALSGLIDLARLREQLLRLRPDPADADSARLVAGAVDFADALDLSLRQGGDPAEGLARLRAKMPPLAALVEIGRGRAQLSQAGRDDHQTRWEALLARTAIAAPLPADDSLDRDLAALAADLAHWPRLEAASTAAQALADAVARAQTASAGQADAAAATVLIEALRAATLQARQAGNPPVAVLARAQALETAVADARTGAAAYAAEAAARILAAAKALQVAAPAKPEAQALVARAAAMVAAPPDPGHVGAALAELATLWAAERDLDLVVNAARPTSRAAGAALPTFDVPGVPGIDLPVTLLMPPRGAGTVQLLRAQRRNEWLSNGFILLATGLAGVLALWAQNPAWGSATDMIAAFLAGLAVNLAIGPKTTA